MPTPVVCRLTNLSTVRLREWTSRRALIPADVPAPKRGTPALYSWQTILVLRLAIVLRESFRIELKAYKPLFDRLRDDLRDRTFASLSGKSLIVGKADDWRIGDRVSVGSTGDDCLVLGLDAHLSAIADAGELACEERADRSATS